MDDLIFIYEVKGQIQGACMAGYDGHRGWLYAVATDSTLRRKGIGKLLIENVLTDLKRLGCGKANLQIRTDNLEVESFYKSLGLETEPRLSLGKHI